MTHSHPHPALYRRHNKLTGIAHPGQAAEFAVTRLKFESDYSHKAVCVCVYVYVCVNIWLDGWGGGGNREESKGARGSRPSESGVHRL